MMLPAPEDPGLSPFIGNIYLLETKYRKEQTCWRDMPMKKTIGSMLFLIVRFERLSPDWRVYGRPPQPLPPLMSYNNSGSQIKIFL